MKLPLEIGKMPCLTARHEVERYEAIVRDCAKTAGDDMRRGGESSVVASLSTAVERAILARYELEPKP